MEKSKEENLIGKQVYWRAGGRRFIGKVVEIHDVRGLENVKLAKLELENGFTAEVFCNYLHLVVEA